MLLTITTTHQPATDLGYLLRKNPARPQSFSLSFGNAHVFYPEASNERCTVALMVEIDPVGLVRNRRVPSGEGGALDQYVNDRPYAASSFLSVAIGDVFGTALAGNSKVRPELVDLSLPLQVGFSALPCRGGESILRKLFEPIGYTVTATRLALDDRFPEWGESPYFRVEFAATVPLKRLLSHLYVLVPVLDDDKHYWVGDDEVTKLMRHGEGWLAAHPECDSITRRYMKHQRGLVDDALARLNDDSDSAPDQLAETHAREEEAIERDISLNEQRLGSVLAVLKSFQAARVLFECARPTNIVVTTPNQEYNVKWETLPAGKYRHRDHRFEWTRAEFQEWANRVAAANGYKTRFLPVGPEDPIVGSPTQMAIFQRGSHE